MAIILLLGSLIFAVAYHYAGQHEPAYQGRSLSSWLGDLEKWPMPPFPTNRLPKMTVRAFSISARISDPACNAVRAMGTNSLPTLLKGLDARDTTWRMKLDQWAKKQSVVKIDTGYVPAVLLRKRAIIGLAALGKMGAPAIPRLIELLADKELGFDAYVALQDIGPASIAPLVRTLDDSRKAVRLQVMQLLGGFSCEADSASPRLLSFIGDQDPAVRATALTALAAIREGEDGMVEILLEGMGDTDGSVRRAAVHALVQSGARSPRIMAAFIHGLDDADREVQYQSLAALGEMGREAKVASPKLFALLATGNTDVTGALCRIDPDAMLPRLLDQLASTN